MSFFKKIHIQSTTELVSLPLITNGVDGTVNGAAYLVYVVYSVPLPALVKAGSIINITAMFEATNPQVYNVEFGRFIKLATSDSDVAIDNLIVVPKADNCTPGNHHWVMSIVKQYLVPTNITNGFINLCTYAVSSSATNGANAIVETGYGHLDVVIDSNGNI